MVNDDASGSKKFPSMASATSQSGGTGVGEGNGKNGAAARRTSATSTNLQSALRALSGHVNDRKLEKMATNFTRLVSLLQKDRADGQKLVKLLGQNADGSGGAGMCKRE